MLLNMRVEGGVKIRFFDYDVTYAELVQKELVVHM